MDAVVPYHPPAAAIGPAGAAAKRSKWALLRLVPVTYFGLFAVACPVGCLGKIATLAVFLLRVGVRRPVPFLLVRELLTIPGWGVLGLVAILTTRAWYAGRWRRAALLSVAFFAMIGVGALIERSLRPS